MSSEWSSIVSTLPEDDSSNGALKTPHKQSDGPRRYAYDRCDDMADKVHDWLLAYTFRQFADQWRDMADQLDRLEHV
jgi:hypothetical protein